MSLNILVQSEIGELQKVIIHRPEQGISRVSPRRSDELLFDDIVYLPSIQKEHDVFASVLKKFLGEENVLYVNQLLLEALDADQTAQEEIIARIIDFEELPSKYIRTLSELQNDRLADVLISGYLPEQDLILFDPIPNFIFTRDIAVIVNDHVIVTKAAKEARFRENFLTRFIFYAHPLFRPLREKNSIINMNDVELFPPSNRGEAISIEGGDLMLINADYLLIGCSERTTQHAILSIRDELFRRGVVKNIVQVNIPNDRSYMHIDTIFTMINHHHIVCYRPLVYDGLSSYVTVHRLDGEEQIYHSVKDFFLAEINEQMQFIFSGNGISPYQEREQWTDGCNLVALKPGVAITYDRNARTQIALEAAGYSAIHASEFLASEMDPANLENVILHIPSSELSRARGGSHCMTLPILRS
ncbi:MAG: arginine deiminase family protein [Saprospiraceae bacterium]|nr:arginine deiminase family protein [Saprospiraceae bacterium]